MKCRGNSLTEYATPLTVFFLAGMVITILGNVPERFKNYVAGTMNAEVEASSLAVQPFGNAVGGERSFQITLPNGEVASLSHRNLGQIVETSGANGATRILAETLAETAERLRQEGTLSGNQADILMQLANQGHRMARIEALLEQAAADANGDRERFDTMRINFEGKNYSAESLADQIGFDSGYESSPFLNDPFNATLNKSTSKEIKEIRRLFQEAVSSGALNDPEARTAVTALTGDILRLAGEVEFQVDRIRDGDIPPEAMRKTMASELTDMDSAGICTTGSHDDTGTHCS